MERVDIAVIGAGAAGIFAALSARGALGPGGSFQPSAEGPEVVLIDGQERPGRKILISGGGRCNVTNAVVDESDYTTEAPNIVRSILREFPVSAACGFFEGRGIEFHEEPLGKLFPEAGRAKGILAALAESLRAARVRTRYGRAVTSVTPGPDGWTIDDELVATRVIVATGGRSIPLTGSTGFGYDLAAALGHDLVPPVPALAPLVGRMPKTLAGITIPAILSVVDGDGRELRRAAGSMLFTHRGVSGPAALDASVAVEQCLAAGTPFRVLADLWTLADPDGAFARFLGAPKLPGACLREPPRSTQAAAIERHLIDARGRKSVVGRALLERLPRRLIGTIIEDAGEGLAALSKQRRREIARRLVALDLQITGTEGFAKAEVTAGGVRLRELARRTLESRKAPGMHFCGEVCDATGRLGGFNFQWAWASGFVAGRGAAAAID